MQDPWFEDGRSRGARNLPQLDRRTSVFPRTDWCKYCGDRRLNHPRYSHRFGRIVPCCGHCYHKIEDWGEEGWIGEILHQLALARRNGRRRDLRSPLLREKRTVLGLLPTTPYWRVPEPVAAEVERQVEMELRGHGQEPQPLAKMEGPQE